MKSVGAALFCLVALLGCFSAAANTNELAQLLTTNQPCRVLLEHAWVGEVRLTVRTGYFTNAGPAELARTLRKLRLNYFDYSDKPSPSHFGPRTLGESLAGGGYRGHYSHRAELPSDEAIRACRTISSLTNLLGPAQGLLRGAPYTTGWQFFTLTPSNNLETLSIFCSRPTPDSSIDNLQVVRGVARQEQ
jgi:hypothetical protein